MEEEIEEAFDPEGKQDGGRKCFVLYREQKRSGYWWGKEEGPVEPFEEAPRPAFPDDER